uniref:Reverse transcriptase domain-containing protein n=1 Tax=Tanacetum cinerariifolium TaxID=118510 RepID=A0A699GHI1_TANCI|nr:reverse transcriptase domain-containing protein [Tanacetum cinerariifolium]
MWVNFAYEADQCREQFASFVIQEGRIQGLEQETLDLDMENKRKKDLKPRYGVTTPQELRRNQIKEETSHHHSYGVTAYTGIGITGSIGQTSNANSSSLGDIPSSNKAKIKRNQIYANLPSYSFYNDYRDRDFNRDNWRSSGRNDYNRNNYQSHSDDKPDLQNQLSDFIKAQHLTNSFVKDTFMDLKNKLETTTKNHQASIQNLEAKFDRFADMQSSRPSRSLPSNTQPNPKGSSSKPYQPSQAQNEHVNAISTRSGKSYDPPVNLNDQQNDLETPINFDSDDEDAEPTPQPKLKTTQSKKHQHQNHINQKSHILNA